MTGVRARTPYSRSSTTSIQKLGKRKPTPISNPVAGKRVQHADRNFGAVSPPTTSTNLKNFSPAPEMLTLPDQTFGSRRLQPTPTLFLETLRRSCSSSRTPSGSRTSALCDVRPRYFLTFGLRRQVREMSAVLPEHKLAGVLTTTPFSGPMSVSAGSRRNGLILEAGGSLELRR